MAIKRIPIDRQENPETLRDCPFCGGSDLYMDSEPIDDTRYHFVVCSKCGACAAWMMAGNDISL